MQTMKVGLVEVPGLLRATYGVTAPYHTIYHAAINGLIAAERRHGRWYVGGGERELAEIARALGLELPDARGPRRRTA